MVRDLERGGVAVAGWIGGGGEWRSVKGNSERLIPASTIRETAE